MQPHIKTLFAPILQEKPVVTVLHDVWPVNEFVVVPAGHVVQSLDCVPLTEYVFAAQLAMAALLVVVQPDVTRWPAAAVVQERQALELETSE
jgi:hypothetical protein